jgi:peptidylprolyl isomerase/FKBP-type peptidyl-prolyl cis-trans isomerase FklB
MQEMSRIFLAAAAALSVSALTAPAWAGPERSPPVTATVPDFLAKNGAAKGVITTASGLQYFIVKSGPAGGPHPTAQAIVTFDYVVRLLNGQLIDSSYERGEPLTGPAGAFVPGFTEALELMRPGDEWIVWVPPALGYGDKDKGPIPGGSVLRFKLALHSVKTAG